MALLGGIRLADNFSATKMPQGAASAWAALDGLEFTGAGYKPLLYVGNQLVNGTNYCLLLSRLFTIVKWSAILSSLLYANLNRKLTVKMTNLKQFTSLYLTQSQFFF